MMENTFSFDSTASRPKHAFALVYDLEGFSRFFNQPDVHEYVPKFLNRVSEAVRRVIFGGDAYWTDYGNKLQPLSLQPTHEKFLGDGALYLWTEGPANKINPVFVGQLCNRLWDLKSTFGEIVQRATETSPVVDLPQRIRFGLARGTVYELRRKGSRQKEYIGFCINLASRLQKYCPDLGFIASARIRLPEATREKSGYTRVVAKQIKGFPKEIVIVDQAEYEGLDAAVRDEYFEPL